MKCLICHSEDIEVKTVYEEFHRGNDVIRFPFDVSVCMNCGERYYDRQTMHKLERIREQLDDQSLPLKEIGKVLVGRA